MTGVLELRIESAGYGNHPVLHDVSLKIPAGSIVTLLGANGAGKTTAVRALSGLIPFVGDAILNGESLSRLSVEKIAGRGVIHVPEGRGTLASMTVLENLLVGGWRRKKSREVQRDLDWIYSLFPRLNERKHQQAGSLSGGEQQMLAVGRALMGDPSYLILDEPSFGLAPLVIEQVFGVLEQIRDARGMGVLLVEQNARMALVISDYGYVLEEGSVRLSGPGEDLLRDPGVVAAYLGS